MMRTRILVLALVPLLALGAAAQTDHSQTIHFSIYAPEQKDSPVRIVGLEHDRSEIHFVLANRSDKSVAAVIIDCLGVVPIACNIGHATEPYWPIKENFIAGFRVNIGPQGRGVAMLEGIRMVGREARPVPPHLPEMIVEEAKSAGVAYMQVQFGVTGVSFQDGTAWPAELAPLLRDNHQPSPSEEEHMRIATHHDPFDPSLVEADDRKCADASTVGKALESVKDIVFDPESPDVSNQDDIAPTLPHIHFSCRLEGPKAVCQLPLETQPKTPPQTR